MPTYRAAHLLASRTSCSMLILRMATWDGHSSLGATGSLRLLTVTDRPLPPLGEAARSASGNSALVSAAGQDSSVMRSASSAQRSLHSKESSSQELHTGEAPQQGQPRVSNAPAVASNSYADDEPSRSRRQEVQVGCRPLALFGPEFLVAAHVQPFAAVCLAGCSSWLQCLTAVLCLLVLH